MNNNDMNTLTSELLELLVQIHNKLLNPSEMIKGSILPPSHIKVIFYLSHKKSMSVSQMAKCLDISKPNMTPIIDKLINDGYVHRYQDPNDRRKINVELTEKAHSFLKEKKIEIKNNLMAKLSYLDEEDLLNLSFIIKNMHKIILKLE
ncbi:MarR family transcriptional regulator [Clostridium sp. Sa3CUN1]|uniref:MarR family transcriptional regulator n=1 Tax=Clostridium gallinarum TaxID=2762246 RepID=A0ABR8Q4L4_9CLOT|nr:MarR family transcriptional regulator [Clostridium gallinarum]MBD7915357.1 MarR family transcriptional regulator [Clostridium gallinarum]